MVTRGGNCKASRGGGLFTDALIGGLGFGVAQVLIGVLGLLFLLPGIYLIAQQTKLKPEERDKGRLWGGVALAALGAVLAGGGWLFVGGGIFAATE